MEIVMTNVLVLGTLAAVTTGLATFAAARTTAAVVAAYPWHHTHVQAAKVAAIATKADRKGPDAWSPPC